MKQLETSEKQIGEYRFFIRPFRAFTAACLSAELVNLVSPILGVIAPLLGDLQNDNDFDILDADAETVFSKAAPALSQISGAKLESTMKTLMISNKNVSVEGPATDGNVQLLSEDLANEIFCGELQDMFVLCFEIVRINYKGFFKKLGDQFGGLTALLKSPKKQITENTESST